MRQRARSIFSIVAVIVAVLISASAVQADTVFQKNGLAIGGYDPVAYFTDGRPVIGKAAHTYQWDGITRLYGKDRPGRLEHRQWCALSKLFNRCPRNVGGRPAGQHHQRRQELARHKKQTGELTGRI